MTLPLVNGINGTACPRASLNAVLLSDIKNDNEYQQCVDNTNKLMIKNVEEIKNLILNYKFI